MIKVSKTVKGDDKMNTKDYIETQKSKKLSDIFKGVLAAGLVVGSMVTSTACKHNQPHESTSTTNSSTSTIETTTTTQQTTTTETTSTTETTKIDEPIIRTDEKAEKLKAIIDAYYEKDVEPKNKKMKIGKYNNGNGKIGCQFAICLKDENILKTIASFDITSEEHDYIKDFAQKLAGDNVEILDDFVFPLNYLIKNFDDKTFDILMNAILSKQSTNQSSQDDPVR